MPRVKLAQPKIKNLKLALLLNGAVTLSGMSMEDVGLAIGKSDDTARRRLKSPGDLTVDELLGLARRTNIPIDELRSALQY